MTWHLWAEDPSSGFASNPESSGNTALSVDKGSCCDAFNLQYKDVDCFQFKSLMILRVNSGTVKASVKRLLLVLKIIRQWDYTFNYTFLIAWENPSVSNLILLFSSVWQPGLLAIHFINCDQGNQWKTGVYPDMMETQNQNPEKQQRDFDCCWFTEGFWFTFVDAQRDFDLHS